MYKKAFTLIEILVAVAIIAILTAVIISNVSSARNTSRDGAIRASLAQYKTEVELYANGRVSNYRDACSGDNVFANSRIPQLQIEIRNAVIQGNRNECRASEDVYAYAYMVGLSSGKGFCIDSTGFGGEVAEDDVKSFANDSRTTCLPQ